MICMKKIMTLSLALIVAMASFAASTPNRLVVSAAGKKNIRIVVDEKTINSQLGGNGSVFENLSPGYHSVYIYQYGRLMYSAAVKIKPMYELSITLDGHGNAIIGEQQMSSKELCEVHYGDAANYEPSITYGDFEGIKAMMADARFDQQRLQIARKAVDNYEISSVQVKAMARLFVSEDTRLEFAKYAYGKTPDKNNYFIVCNTFPFGDNKADLTNYIRNYR